MHALGGTLWVSNIVFVDRQRMYDTRYVCIFLGEFMDGVQVCTYDIYMHTHLGAQLRRIYTARMHMHGLCLSVFATYLVHFHTRCVHTFNNARGTIEQYQI